MKINNYFANPNSVVRLPLLLFFSAKLKLNLSICNGVVFTDMLQHGCCCSRMIMLLITTFLLMAAMAINIAEGKLCYSECSTDNVIEVSIMPSFLPIYYGPVP
jgi:hypothetical protein